jgi:biopolymer transport protein ExbD
MAHPAPTINTTPLIDVLLVLLVLLIMTLPKSTHRVSLDLPQGLTSDRPPSSAIVEVDFDGQVSWNGSRVANDEQLEHQFREVADTPIRVRVDADRHVRYERVAQVLASAQRAHVSNLSVSPVTD